MRWGGGHAPPRRWGGADAQDAPPREVWRGAYQLWSTVMPLTHQLKMDPTRIGTAAELHVYATESFVKRDA